MGGSTNKQSKHQPRVKGNLKPSSSSRAANLEGIDTAAINAFKANPALAFSQFSNLRTSTGNSTTYDSDISSMSSSSAVANNGERSGHYAKGSDRGFSASRNGPGSKSSSTTSMSSKVDMLNIDGELASLIKRLNKQDAQTRLKAIKEISAYIDQNSGGQQNSASGNNQLNGMLLVWPNTYSRHIFDIDRRVRVGVSRAHKQFVSIIGKKLAPRLKEIAPAWICSFFDPHREVSQLSKQAFEDAFPQSKRMQVLNYCLQDLIEFVRNSVQDETPESLGDPRFLDKEQLQSKYEHIVSCSLRCAGLLLDELDKDVLLKNKEIMQPLFESKKTWRFIKQANVSSLVKRSAYKLIRSLMLKCPELVTEEGVTTGLSPVLLAYGLLDKDPANHGDLLDACLLTTKCFPSIWEPKQQQHQKHLSTKRPGNSLVSSLFTFLSTICPISPKVTYPSILALLAQMPTILTYDPQFQVNFFDAIWDGSKLLDLSDMVSSAKISIAFVTSITECLVWFCVRMSSPSPTLSQQNSASGNGDINRIAAKELDRIWHYYLRSSSHSGLLAPPLASFYIKLASNSKRLDLLENLWNQTSWFAMKRLSLDTAMPITLLATSIYKHPSETTSKGFGLLTNRARDFIQKLMEFAYSTEDHEVARIIIHELIDEVPDIVFCSQESTDRVTALLSSVGLEEDSASLIVSRVGHIMMSSGLGDEDDVSKKTTEALKIVNSEIQRLAELFADHEDDRSNISVSLESVCQLIKELTQSQFLDGKISADDSPQPALPALDKFIATVLIPWTEDDELTLEEKFSKQDVTVTVTIFIRCILLYIDGTCFVSKNTFERLKKYIVSTVYRCYLLMMAASEDHSQSDNHCQLLVECFKAWRHFLSNTQYKSRFIDYLLLGPDESKDDEKLIAKSLFVLYELASATAASSSSPNSLPLISPSASGKTSGSGSNGNKRLSMVSNTSMGGIGSDLQQSIAGFGTSVKVAASTAWSAVLAVSQQSGLQDSLANILADAVVEQINDLRSVHSPAFLVRLGLGIIDHVASGSKCRSGSSSQGNASAETLESQDTIDLKQKLWEKFALIGWSGWKQVIDQDWDSISSKRSSHLSDTQSVGGKSQRIVAYHNVGETVSAIGQSHSGKPMVTPGLWHYLTTEINHRSPSTTASGTNNSRFDEYGLTRFGRRVVFVIEMLQQHQQQLTLNGRNDSELADSFIFPRNTLSSPLSPNDSDGFIAYWSNTASLILHLVLAWVLIEDVFNTPVTSIHKDQRFVIAHVEDLNSEIADMVRNTQQSIMNWSSKLFESPLFNLPVNVLKHIDDADSATLKKEIRSSPSWITVLMRRICELHDADVPKPLTSATTIWDSIVLLCIQNIYDNSTESTDIGNLVSQPLRGHPIWSQVLGNIVLWSSWDHKLDKSILETECVSTLQNSLQASNNSQFSIQRSLVVTAVTRALNIQQYCSRLPSITILVSYMLDEIIAKLNDPQQLIFAFDLLNLLLPLQKDVLDGSSVLVSSVIRQVVRACSKYSLPESEHTRFVSERIHLAAVALNISCARTIALLLDSVKPGTLQQPDIATIVDVLISKWLSAYLCEPQQNLVVQTASALTIQSLINLVSQGGDSNNIFLVKPLVDNLVEFVASNKADIGTSLYYNEGAIVSSRVIIVDTVSQAIEKDKAQYQYLSQYPRFSSSFIKNCLSSPSSKTCIACMKLLLKAPSTLDFFTDESSSPDEDSLSDDTIALAKFTKSCVDEVSSMNINFTNIEEELMDDICQSAIIRLLSIVLIIAKYLDDTTKKLGRDKKEKLIENVVVTNDGSGLLDCALHVIGKILNFVPESPSSQSNIGTKAPAISTPTTTRKPFNLSKWSLDDEDFDISTIDPTDLTSVQIMASITLYRLVRTIPASFRTWLHGLVDSHGYRVAIEKYVVKYISPKIIEQELKSTKLPNSSINKVVEDQDGYSSTRISFKSSKVSLQFRVGDYDEEETPVVLEASVRLPQNYPIEPPEFETVRRVAVSEKRWRAWIVASQSILLARNGSLDDACALYLRNIGAHFDGVEDCTICYSAVGVMDNQLPNKQCKTCKNMFHSACLFKWFRSSSQSTCPLCRSIF
ncbi:hypothetical protein H4219_004801 [Mycoemilia scoparia]|uniref:E3 ubiquitin-protein ligase listerin n=1 Tax=Mycoemilia scoparia TaxID=417184 RepID=A0A9W7ZQD8_9FUNG|nr:hypothetical protein H4219_004801 [Mycoemilia scoparia]